jgi:hypothetical protein
MMSLNVKGAKFTILNMLPDLLPPTEVIRGSVTLLIEHVTRAVAPHEVIRCVSLWVT